ncbi:hypothetical protein H696_02116 [Fonticula alba]|uniref:50S ribosomal protein L10 n=1 Tax=Fonticula alba TaxID=691883 RepID=A0A058ZA82_FONAL|nr:hypothetical protein H696_02116 [Fonticula alba]KCV71165.1 hypothetical protein H696_02116 [Fonticula alba]|eukprot:XP_009494288.1 hypothetical protein H696_02116 [Fonticula alba]
MSSAASAAFVRNRPFSILKRTRYNQCLEIADRPFFAVVQYNNLNTTDLQAIRQELSKKGLSATAVPSNIFRRAVLNDRPKLHRIANFFHGPTMVIYSKEQPAAPTPEDPMAHLPKPAQLKDILSVVQSYGRLVNLGGSFEGSPLSLEDMVSLSKVSSRLDIYGQLLSLLNNPAQSLTQSLNQHPSSLAFALQQYLDRENGPAEEAS